MGPTISVLHLLCCWTLPAQSLHTLLQDASLSDDNPSPWCFAELLSRSQALVQLRAEMVPLMSPLTSLLMSLLILGALFPVGLKEDEIFTKGRA